jgi:hypothetical protein
MPPPRFCAHANGATLSGTQSAIASATVTAPALDQGRRGYFLRTPYGTDGALPCASLVASSEQCAGNFLARSVTQRSP